jgi:hypothetical protein
MVDIEADGPIPGDYSMISIGAVIVDAELDKTFYGILKPISDKYSNEALRVSGFTRDETLLFDDPTKVMKDFYVWIVNNSKNRHMFISDNNGFDWMFVCWYFHHFIGENPFGYSSTNLGSFYKGIVQSFRHNFKHLRKTKHTHNPVDDAKGNAEAFLTLINKYKIEINL